MRNAFLTVVFTLAACGSTSTTSATAADAVSDDATADVTANADVAADAVDDVASIPRNPACGPFDDKTNGTKRPWTGFSQGGFSFTCNTCRGGYGNLNGAWRFIDFQTEDPATDLNGYSETLTFDGNTWQNHMKGNDKGAATDAQVAGWYFCGDAVEMSATKQAHEVLIVEQATPNGAFGNTVGDAYGVSIKVNANNSNLIAVGLYQGIDGKYQYENLYCRIGSTIKGHPCADPFTGK